MSEEQKIIDDLRDYQSLYDIYLERKSTMNVLDAAKELYREAIMRWMKTESVWTTVKNKAWEELILQIPEVGKAVDARRAALLDKREASLPDELLGQQITSAIGAIAGELKPAFYSRKLGEKEKRGHTDDHASPSPRGDEDWFGAQPRASVQHAIEKLSETLPGIGDSAVVCVYTASSLATALAKLKRDGKGEFSYKTLPGTKSYFVNGDLQDIVIARVTRIA